MHTRFVRIDLQPDPRVSQLSLDPASHHRAGLPLWLAASNRSHKITHMVEYKVRGVLGSSEIVLLPSWGVCVCDQLVFRKWPVLYFRPQRTKSADFGSHTGTAWYWLEGVIGGVIDNKALYPLGVFSNAKPWTHVHIICSTGQFSCHFCLWKIWSQ